MDPTFSGRQLVVTGGLGALGSAVVARLLEAGAHCHVPQVPPGVPSPDLPLPYRDHPRLTLHDAVDLTDAGAVEAFYSGLPVLWASIHCAGGFGMAPIAETDERAYRHLMALNAESCFLCCRHALARIRAGGEGGRLVNVAARPAVEPRTGAGMVAYTMSKAAVAALTQALAEEVADEGIWVNAVAPSIIDTPANRDAMPDAAPFPWPSPDDLAETIVFLASPANRAGRGAVIPVYGAG
ncbi:MAG: SDR family NAD(P)-dependent oxidoreductase [Holophagales bacterium]|nr:SDR family NAD(P)-dependent oxidoreductase [Holophagales bacterium]